MTTANPTRTISRMNAEDRLQRFVQAVENAPGNHYCNIVIAQVDPDAMGSSVGVAELLQALGKQTAIWYSGAVAHSQNKVLRNRFNLGAELTHISKFSALRDDETSYDAGDIWARENNLVLVDSCLGSDSRLRFQMKPIIVIDHHRNSDLVDDPYYEENGFLWLDESVGSASTMVTELLQAAISAGLMGEEWKLSEKVATLLAMGIYTDTTNLVSAGKRDRDAYGWLQGFTNDQTISDIIDYPLDETNLRNMWRALDPTNRKHHNAHLLSGLGIIDADYADDLSTMCNLFLRKPGVEVAITWAGVRFVNEDSGEETIRLRVCARSRTLLIDLADFLEKRFKGKCGAKQLPNGRGEGGALFELEFDGWMKPDDMLNIVDKRLREWLFDDDVEPQND